ncbi:MAG: hypothetical protein ACFE75_10050 [Candidatus Hodarchaeota archaeon]
MSGEELALIDRKEEKPKEKEEKSEETNLYEEAKEDIENFYEFRKEQELQRLTYPIKKDLKSKISELGRSIVALSAIIGLISILLFYVLPDTFYLWHIEMTGYYDVKVVFGGFSSGAYQMGGGIINLRNINFIEEEATLIFAGIITIFGILMTLIGAGKGSRGAGIGGGFFLLLAPILFMGALMGGAGIFSELADIVGIVGQNLLFGSISDMGTTVTWGIGAGTILPLVAGVLGLIGGGLIRGA